MRLSINLSINFPYIKGEIFYPCLVNPWIQEELAAMVSKTCVVILICVGSCASIQSLVSEATGRNVPRVPGYEYTSDIASVGPEHTSDSLPLPAARRLAEYTSDSLPPPAACWLAEFMSDMDSVGPKHTSDSLSMPAARRVAEFISGYANMIRTQRNEAVDTRMREAGKIIVNKKLNDALPKVPCTCANREELIDLTMDWGIVYPYVVRNLTCSDDCVAPYTCQREIYNMTVLKWRPELLTLNADDINKLNGGYDMPLPKELARRWAPKTIPVNIGCHCTLA